MKKIKAPPAMESASSFVPYQDPRIRFKHQSLMQDYQELHKETEAKKERLELMKQKKLILLAEVRFLRRRYKYLMHNQNSNAHPQPRLAEHPNVESQGRIPAKERYHGAKGTVLRQQGPRFDLNGKEKVRSRKKVQNGKEATAIRIPVPVFDLNKERPYSGKEAAVRNPAPVFDLNQNERIYVGKETSERNILPAFDLNQISKEEEELQADYEPTREEPKKGLMRGGNDDLQNDVKLSICRNIGDGSNRTGKRKISWQDQVALKV